MLLYQRLQKTAIKLHTHHIGKEGTSVPYSNKSKTAFSFK